MASNKKLNTGGLESRSADLAATAEQASLTLSALPLSILLCVFSLLPVTWRARAACVCRGWRAALSEPSLWQRLDLNYEARDVTDAILFGAAAKARGRLLSLDVSWQRHVSFEALLAVVEGNAGTLRELRVGTGNSFYGCTLLDGPHVEQLLQAAPQLEACHARVLVNVADARRMLRNEPPFERLRLHTLTVRCEEETEETVMALVSDLASFHASLTTLKMWNLPDVPAVLDAVVDVALARCFESVGFQGIVPSLDTAPAVIGAVLGRLVAANTPALTELSVSLCCLDDESLTPLLQALPHNTHLRSLDMTYNTISAACARDVLLPAVRANTSLRKVFADDDCGTVEGVTEATALLATRRGDAAAAALVRRRRTALRRAYAQMDRWRMRRGEQGKET